MQRYTIEVDGFKSTCSDGYHTFDDLYDHRCLLFISLCLTQPKRCAWKNHYNGYVVLYLELKSGQISYHVPTKFLPLFETKIEQKEFYVWDNHTSNDVVTRLTNEIRAID